MITVRIMKYLLELLSPYMNKKGFTIIEIVIAMTLIAFIIPAVSSILLTLLQQQRALTQLSQMKREGDSILKFVRSRIQEDSFRVSATNPNTAATSLRCNDFNNAGTRRYDNPAGTAFFLIPRNPLNDFRIFRSGNTLNYSLNNGAAQLINSPAVLITDFRIGCSLRSEFSAPIIYVNFTVAPRIQIPGLNRQRSLYFRSQIKLSTY